MSFTSPKQDRSRLTTESFLDALEACLNDSGMSRTTIDRVAARCGLGRGAFISRFGSKRAAVLVLYERYADLCLDGLVALRSRIGEYSDPVSFLTDLYRATEDMQRAHFGLNFAMSQDFSEELVTVDGTKRVFRGFLDVMQALEAHFLTSRPPCRESWFAASQLIISTSLNFVLRAMPGMPRDRERRHVLMGKVAWLALSQVPEPAQYSATESPPR